jgi:hypothetical protein
MSASGKLKALDTGRELYVDEGYHMYTVAKEENILVRSLPQIVAVVEAAENHVRPDVWIEGQPLHGPSIFAETNNETTASESLAAALSALEEALT